MDWYGINRPPHLPLSESLSVTYSPPKALRVASYLLTPATKCSTVTSQTAVGLHGLRSLCRNLRSWSLLHIHNVIRYICD